MSVRTCGEIVVYLKCVVNCPALGAALAHDAAYMEDVQLRPSGEAIVTNNDDLAIGSAPAGTPEFAARHFDDAMMDQLSYIEQIDTKLRSGHAQSLWVLTRYAV